jgi:hypothetical protein
MPLILTCFWGERVNLKNESNLFATKSNLSRVYVYISLLVFMYMYHYLGVVKR